ncbi:methylenetetrahydrofolate reductase [Myxococcota bacterium]
MRVANLFREKSSRPAFSFEFSRPKDEKAAASLDKALDTLKRAEPAYVSVTFGAGGSTREGSFELVDKLKNEKGFEVVAYIAGVGLGPDDLVAVCDKFKSLRVETLFVVRGDPPKGDAAFTPHPDAMAHATDMLAFIRNRYDFCLGAAGHPEGHAEAQSKDKDLDYLKAKVENGAEYIVAQYVYDNQYFFDFVERCRTIGISVPIIPGIMPIFSVKMMEILAGICGVTITDAVRQGLAKLPSDDKKAVSQFGIDFATEQCRGLLEHGVPGIHFYTMNRGKGVSTILGTLQEEGLL